MRFQKLALISLFVGINLSLFAQNDTLRTMRSFVPTSNAYDIYYPLDFLIKETENGIVTITDTATQLNITISNYSFEKN